MAEEGVKLFASTGSPITCRVVIALKLKGVDYEYVEEDLSNKSADLLKYNPVYKKVPVLVHNGKPIAESLIIVEYIDDTWKVAPILPEDPYERAMARFWANFIDEKLAPVLRKAFSTKGDEQKAAIEEGNELLRMLEDQLKGKKFFGGDTVGLLDIAANFIGFWLGILEEVTGLVFVTKERFPRLSEWIDEFLNCTIIKESLPPRERVARGMTASATVAEDRVPAGATTEEGTFMGATGGTVKTIGAATAVEAAATAVTTVE